MMLERAYTANRESLRGRCWILELIVALGAIALFSAGLKQRSWVTAGLSLLLLSFLLRRGVVGHFSIPTPFDVPWALLLVGAIAGLWVSYDVDLSVPVLLMLLASVSLYYVAANAPQSQALAQAVVLVGLAVGAYFLAQYQYVGSQDKSVVASAVGNTLSGPFPRLGSWSPSSNGMASLLEGLVPVGVALAVTGHPRAWRIVGGVAVVVMGLALLVTASRGAWVALSVGAVLWVASRRRASLIALVAVVSIAVVSVGGYLALSGNADLEHVPVAGPALYELFVRPDRLAVYRGSLRLIQDFALTGIGLGEVFAMVYSRYVLLIQVPFLTYSHNLYLTVWLGHGLLGVLAVGWLLVALILRVFREEKRGRAGALFQAAWIGVIIVLVHGLFDARQYVDLWTMWPLFVLLGLAVSSSVLSEASGSTSRAHRLPAAAWVALALPVLLGAVAWRPLAATAAANIGAIWQAKAELGKAPTQSAESYLRNAVTWYERAAMLDPANRTAQLRLGNLAVDAGRYEEAVALLEPVWRASPEDPTARKALGLAYMWVGQATQAAELLRGSPNIVAELNAWGWWHHEQGRRQLAIQAYQVSLLLNHDQDDIERILMRWEAE